MFAALKPGGLVCAYGYTARMEAQKDLLSTLLWLARAYAQRSLLGWLQGGKRIKPYSINLMRARHPDWFKEDLALLFRLLADGKIRPHVAERITFADVADAHRRLEAGGLQGKLVLCPGLDEREPAAAPQVEQERVG